MGRHHRACGLSGPVGIAGRAGGSIGFDGPGNVGGPDGAAGR